MQKYSFLFKSQHPPLKNLTFVHFLTFLFMPASHARCNGGTYFPALWYSVLGVLWWLGGWHSVPERAFYGTEYACRAKKGFLGYRMRFLRHSVRRTGFWGTEAIFGAGNALLRYATRFQRRRTADSADCGQPSAAPDTSSKAQNSRLRYAPP